MYMISSFAQSPRAISSSMTSCNTSPEGLNRMKLIAFSSMSSHSPGSFVWFFDNPHRFFFRSLLCQGVKDFPLPYPKVSFSIKHFSLAHDARIYLCHHETPCFSNLRFLPVKLPISSDYLVDLINTSSSEKNRVRFWISITLKIANELEPQSDQTCLFGCLTVLLMSMMMLAFWLGSRTSSMGRVGPNPNLNQDYLYAWVPPSGRLMGWA